MNFPFLCNDPNPGLPLSWWSKSRIMDIGMIARRFWSRTLATHSDPPQSNSVVGVSVVFGASKAGSMWQSWSGVAFSRVESMVHVAKYPNLEKHKPTEDESCRPFPIVIHWHEPLTPGHKYHRFSPKIRYLCCMNPTAGSFIVNQRLQRHFWTCAVPFPEQCLDFDRWTKRSP